jgi:putative glutamine amidotransferase
MKSPLIGITAERSTRKSEFPKVSVGEAYLQAIYKAGASPVIIPPGMPEETFNDLVPRLDGILFTGGGDIHPHAYGESPHPVIKEIDEDRDRAEFRLLENSLKNGRPFLGICRGLQVINVGLGGKLYADIASQHAQALKHDFYPGWDRNHLAHKVEVDKTSHLMKILGDHQQTVNSLHHQAVLQLAPGLIATAHSPDGLVEALEVKDHPFGVAVQWHPEWLTEHAAMRGLFRALVEAASET